MAYCTKVVRLLFVKFEFFYVTNNSSLFHCVVQKSHLHLSRKFLKNNLSIYCTYMYIYTRERERERERERFSRAMILNRNMTFVILRS